MSAVASLPLAALLATSSAATAVNSADKMAMAFGHCLVERSDERALLNVLDQPFPTVATGKALGGFINAACLPKRGPNFRSSLIGMRKLLYNALYLKKFGHIALDLIPSQPLSYPLASDVPELAGQKNYREATILGDCVVRASPKDARALVLTEVGSYQEGTAFNALMPTLKGCVIEGQQTPVEMQAVRLVISEPLFRMTELQERRRMAQETVH